MPPQPGVRRAQTRARVLAAALGVFAEQGYGGATVEAITGAAGLTRGAFYSNFTDKAEVFLQLMDDHTAAQLSRTRAMLENVSPDTAIAIAAKAAAHVDANDRRWFLISTEFTLLAVRDATVASRLREHDASIRVAIAALLSEAFAASDREALVPILDLASVVVALREGALMQACVDPLAVPPGHLEQTFLPLLLAAASR